MHKDSNLGSADKIQYLTIPEPPPKLYRDLNKIGVRSFIPFGAPIKSGPTTNDRAVALYSISIYKSDVGLADAAGGGLTQILLARKVASGENTLLGQAENFRMD